MPLQSSDGGVPTSPGARLVDPVAAPARRPVEIVLEEAHDGALAAGPEDHAVGREADRAGHRVLVMALVGGDPRAGHGGAVDSGRPLDDRDLRPVAGAVAGGAFVAVADVAAHGDRPQREPVAVARRVRREHRLAGGVGRRGGLDEVQRVRVRTRACCAVQVVASASLGVSETRTVKGGRSSTDTAGASGMSFRMAEGRSSPAAPAMRVEAQGRNVAASAALAVRQCAVVAAARCSSSVVAAVEGLLRPRSRASPRSCPSSRSPARGHVGPPPRPPAPFARSLSRSWPQCGRRSSARSWCRRSQAAAVAWKSFSTFSKAAWAAASAVLAVSRSWPAPSVRGGLRVGSKPSPPLSVASVPVPVPSASVPSSAPAVPASGSGPRVRSVAAV